MAIMMALLVTGFTSCSKDNTTSAGTNGIGTVTSTTIVQGNWKVTYFSDNGTDRTADFNGFKFSFIAGGTVAASNTLLAVNGTWSSYGDDSQEKLVLPFPNSLSFAKLNNDWHIVEKTAIKLRMEDISGGSGGTDYLTIEKI